MATILIVCHGNIHRSPTAEALMRQALASAGIRGVDVASRGVHVHDEGLNLVTKYPDDARAARSVLEAHGIEMWRHRSRRFSAEDAQNADLVLAVDRLVLAELRRRHPLHTEKFRLFNALRGDEADVEDPIGGDTEAFRHMVDEMVETIEENLPTLLAWAGVQATPTP